jgi:hypothetical protein
MLEDEVMSRRRASKYLAQDGQGAVARAEEQRAAAVEHHLVAVTGELPEGYKVRRIPKFNELLSSTKMNVTYAIYVLSSQYSPDSTPGRSCNRSRL